MSDKDAIILAGVSAAVLWWVFGRQPKGELPPKEVPPKELPPKEIPPGVTPVYSVAIQRLTVTGG